MRHITRDQIIGFRLTAHGLRERGTHGMEAAAGRCGLQDSPPGSALLALHARVAGVGPSTVDEAIETRSLLRTWSLRGAPYVVPTASAAVFTAGVLPPDEAALRHFLLGVGPSLDALGMSIDEAVAATGDQAQRVLATRRLAIEPLGAEVAAGIADTLTPSQRRTWESEGQHAAGQTVGEAVAHFCVRVLTLRGVVCFAPREGNSSPFVLVEEWLGGPLPPLAPERARAELVRRYLRCYGPAKRADFASWLGVRAGDIAPWWDLVAEELEPVDVDGTRAFIHADDADSLAAPPGLAGTRLLPPRDPYTQIQDRDTLVDPRRHRVVWRTVGDPGTVLLDGRIAGIWRPRKRGRNLTLTISPFAATSKRERAALEDEALALGPLRGATAVDVEFTDP